MLLQNSIVKYIGFSGGAPALGRRGFDPLGETRTFFETRSVYWDTKSRFFKILTGPISDNFLIFDR